MLGIPLLKKETEPAEELYLKAESLMTKFSPDSALSLFREINDNHKKSAFAPKALFTLGWMYENVICNNDSAAAVYRRVLKDYPGTSFALRVQSKVDAFDQLKREEEEKKKAIADSIRTASERKKAIEDSVSTAVSLPKGTTVLKDSTAVKDSVVLKDSTVMKDSVVLKDSTGGRREPVRPIGNDSSRTIIVPDSIKNRRD